MSKAIDDFGPRRKWSVAIALALVATLTPIAALNFQDSEGAAARPLLPSAAPPVSRAPFIGKAVGARKASGSRARPPSGRGPEAIDAKPVPMAEPAPAKPAVDAQTLVVQFDKGTDSAEIDRSLEAAGATRVASIEAIGAVVVKVADRKEATERLKNDPNVQAVEPNHLRYASADPNDPGYPDQGHLFSGRFPLAWELTKGSGTVDVAIVDTGVDLDHPDLDGRIAAGHDFVNGDAVAQDDNGHGTMVAGIAAAETNNSIGVAGAAWNARIIPVKVLDADGGGTDADVAQGITWAASHGAEVINLSLGGPGSSQTLTDAVTYAVSQGVLVVAATGNEGTSEPSYPAAIPGVIGVGATDVLGNVVAFSNFGPQVDLVAPGTDIVSTALVDGPDEAYGVGDGTSFSAPIVSGVALAMKARTPTLNVAQLAQKLVTSASDRGPAGRDDSYGRGLLDAYGAVGGRTAASPPRTDNDRDEPNDVVDRATPTTQPIYARIQPESDVDWYSVNLPSDGTITVRAEQTEAPTLTAAFDPIIDIYAPDMRFLAHIDASEVGGNEETTIDSVGTGTYFYVVTNGVPTPSDLYRTSVDLNLQPPGSAAVTPGPFVAVRSTVPTDRTLLPSTSMHPTVTFATSIDPASVTTTTVRLRDLSSDTAVTSVVSYDDATKTATIAPAAALIAGRTYGVFVTGIKDANGTLLVDPPVWRFTVVKPDAKPPTKADVNGDGFDDVIVGSPGEDVGSIKDAGAFHVLFGSSVGAKTSGSKIYTQDTADVPGAAEAGDRLGAAIATGDVNNDGYDDVAVGAPGEDLGAIADAGLVHVFLGSSTGLRAAGSQTWTQDSAGIAGTAEKGDRFGASLAFGDFDSSAGADLAIGASGEAIGSAANAGALYALSGRSNGVTATGSKSWTQDTIDGFFAAGNAFAASLAVGDFDGDTHDDLVAGAPGEDVTDVDQGTVTLFNGTIVGLRPGGAIWSEILTSLPAPRGERFGTALASADFGGLADTDEYDDLAIGAPGDASSAGRVDVLFSNWIGPGLRYIAIRQSTTGGNSQPGDVYGSSLAAARTKAATTGWLSIGAPGEDVGGAADAGVIHVLQPLQFYDGSSLIAQPIGQNTGNVPDTAEAHDRFGTALRMLDVDKDGLPDVVVGTPNESVGSLAAAGTVHVLRRADLVVNAIPQQLVQGKGGIPSAAEVGDAFGASLGG